MAKSERERHSKTTVGGYDSDLENRYIIERFYDCIGNVFANFTLAFMLVDVFMYLFLPGARYAASVNFVYWLYFFSVCKYISRYKGTEHQEYGKRLFETSIETTFPIHEFLQVSNSSLASEEGRRAHAAMVILTVYLLSFLICRLASPRYKKSLLWYIPLPLIALKYPRFGIFAPGFEALAFLVAIGTGHAIASHIDDMRWKHFLSLHEADTKIEKTSRELSKETRKGSLLMEALNSYNDSSSFFDIIR